MKRLHPAETLGLVAGFAIWSSAFVLIYAAHGWACGSGLQVNQGSVRAILAVLLGLHLAAHAVLCVWLYRRMKTGEPPQASFLKLASFVLAVGAGGATVWTSAPVLFLEIC
ncbi:MAG: hypothetical protein ACK46Q_07870 [Hyphomonas sp.]